MEDLGVVASGHRPLHSQSLRGCVALSDGDHPVCSPFHPSGRLDGLHRSSGGVPAGSGSSEVSSLPSLCLQWSRLPIQSAVLWPIHGSAGVLSGHGSCFKNTKNLFIHIALIPEGDNPRVHPNILKCLLHSPVAKGYRLVVIASRAMVCKTPTYYLILYPLAFARGCVILRSHILFPLLLILLISHHI